MRLSPALECTCRVYYDRPPRHAGCGQAQFFAELGVFFWQPFASWAAVEIQIREHEERTATLKAAVDFGSSERGQFASGSVVGRRTLSWDRRERIIASDNCARHTSPKRKSVSGSARPCGEALATVPAHQGVMLPSRSSHAQTLAGDDHPNAQSRSRKNFFAAVGNTVRGDVAPATSV